jgi:hypothetical protein
MAAVVHHVRRNLVAYLALLVALSSTSYAASTKLLPKNSVGSAQVINGSLQKGDLSKKTVAALALRGARGPQGPPGAQGAQGTPGATGPPRVLWARKVHKGRRGHRGHRVHPGLPMSADLSWTQTLSTRTIRTSSTHLSQPAA